MASDSSDREIGLLMQYDDPLRENLDVVRHAERRGFTQVWQAEYRLGREAVSPTAAYAAVTDEIQVGLGVVNPWTRNVALLAQTLCTLDDLAGPDRTLGGIGAWWDPLAAKVGIDRTDPNPLRAIRETVEVVRALLDGETVSYAGAHVDVDEIELETRHNQDAPPVGASVYVGATGFTSVQLTGEFADGVLGNYLVSPAYNERAMDALERGADRADRDVDDVARSQTIVCAMDEDVDVAIEAARRFIMNYEAPRPTVTEVRKLSGLSQDVVDDMMDVLGGWPASDEKVEEALETIPEDVVFSLTACGTPEDVRRRVREYADTEYCQCPVLYPATGNFVELIDAFADGY